MKTKNNSSIKSKKVKTASTDIKRTIKIYDNGKLTVNLVAPTLEVYDLAIKSLGVSKVLQLGSKKTKKGKPL